jgi:YrbI family 3-deoxy-D-manno-octulosonate 8-phosphate phosphatase
MNKNSFKLRTIIFDFDGVLTDNRVFCDSNGNEFVACSRADGLAFDVLKKLKYNLIILSTEKNPVVSARAKKLGIPVIQGVSNKKDELMRMEHDGSINLEHSMFVGNDLNDYRAMEVCGYRCCPFDSHPLIKEFSNVVLKTMGGHGVVREVAESVLRINFLDYIN